jgi:hypothetical protein
MATGTDQSAAASTTITDRAALVRATNHGMSDNPYHAPQTPQPDGTRFELIRVSIALVLLAFGLLTGIGAARHFLSLFSGPGPGREIGAFGFPAFGTATAGFVTSAIGIARSRAKLAAAGVALILLGIGGWYLFLYAVMAGWFQ